MNLFDKALGRMNGGENWWRSGVPNTATGVCAVLAIDAEVAHNNAELLDHLALFSEANGLADHDQSVIAFNDDPGTSWEDMALAFKRASVLFDEQATA